MNQPKIVSREEVAVLDAYREMMKKESHHEHLIEKIDVTYRWQPDKVTQQTVGEIGFNRVMNLFAELGIHKNTEAYRNLYRRMGYSLDGYWEVFYWESNNPNADLYVQPEGIQMNQVLELGEILKKELIALAQEKRMLKGEIGGFRRPFRIDEKQEVGVQFVVDANGKKLLCFLKGERGKGQALEFIKFLNGEI